MWPFRNKVINMMKSGVASSHSISSGTTFKANLALKKYHLASTKSNKL